MKNIRIKIGYFLNFIIDIGMIVWLRFNNSEPDSIRIILTLTFITLLIVSTAICIVQLGYFKHQEKYDEEIKQEKISEYENMKKFNIAKGDITKKPYLEAIVNAANSTLVGGDGADGQIHAVAGNELYDECKTLGGCKTGEAKITKAYNLPNGYIIHTVGPIYTNINDSYTEEQASTELVNCYLNSLKLAKTFNIKTIGFPAISTGIYGFPFDKATKIAISTILKHQKDNNNSPKIELIFYSDEDYEKANKIYKEYLDS